MIEIVDTPDAPKPAGHYSQGIVHKGLVFVAGQLPIRPDRGEHVLGPVEEQVEQAMRNVEAILENAGSGLDRLLSVTIYITDIALWPRVNAVYSAIMGAHRPARAVVPVPALHHGYVIEIQAIAAIDAA